jgi:hypothetical protein
MAAEAYTVNGSKMHIAPAQATTPADATAYAALTWTEITLLTNIPEYGDSASIQTIDVIGDGRTRKGKGSRNAGGGDLTVLPKPSDPGQIALEAAEATQSYYPIKVTIPNRLTGGGTDQIDYFMALIAGKRQGMGGNNDFVVKRYSLEVSSAIVTTVPT